MEPDTICANCGDPITSLNSVELFTGQLICEECREEIFGEDWDDDEYVGDDPDYLGEDDDQTAQASAPGGGGE